MNESLVIRKLNARLLPFLMLCFFVAILDRVNIGIASLTMNQDLGFGPEVFGFGAGIFFFGYFFFEIPSNLVLSKVGARKWIARIMISWGIVSIAMMFVNSVTTFYVLRVLLGVAEAGFYPGIIFYITTFYPAKHRTRALGFFQMASPIAVMIGSPISGLLLGLNGVLDIKGWQWLFLLEGIPAIVLGFLCFTFLVDSPKKAKWLSKDEQDWLVDSIEAENKQKDLGHLSFIQLFKKPQFLLQVFVYFCIVIGLYGVSFWLPQIIQSTSASSNLVVSFLSAVPSLFAAVAIYFVAKSSQKTGENKLHSAISLIIGGIGLLISAFTAQPVISLLALAIASAGIQASIPPFWGFPSKLFVGAAAAGAIATINSFGNLGGFVGPYVVGYLKESTGVMQSGLVFLACVLFLGAAMTFFLKTKITDQGNTIPLKKAE
jgi:ACS family tartrate transporter-like MFS transporter